MKKILALLISLLVSSTCYADACTTALGVNFPANQKNALCAAFGSAINTSLIPGTTNAIDLGSATKFWRDLFVGESIVGSFEAVAGAGTTVADAAQLSASKIVHEITGANGTLGWKMSADMPVSSIQILLNTTAGVAKIYAESGGTVNGAAADAAFSALTGIKPIICIKTAALTYICS